MNSKNFVIKNDVDFTTGIQPSSFPTVFGGNDKATSWTGKEAPFGYVDWWPHSLYVNTEVAPWSDKNVRWALSYYIDRSKIVDISWSGASQTTPLPMPSYPPLQPYFDATKPLLEKYNTLEYNPAKGDELLTAKGWKKDGNGMWQDEKGQPVKLDIISFFDFTSVGPVLVEMLKRGGIDSSYSEPPDMFDNFSQGKFTGCLFGHGGSCREPQETMALYQSSSEAIPGGHAVNFSRWHNDAFDKLADQAYVTPPTDTKALIDIWVKGMEIWLPDLPDIQLTQGFHRLPWTTQNWTNMPDAKNPYTNSAQWHLTFALVLHNVKPSA
jgi:peptide/nickel transport system substrate-binding protein